jgi:urease accessory protein
MAGGLVAFFALFHGHAHGAELPAGASGLGYAAGFVVATIALHATGIALGMLNKWPAGERALRAGGGLVAAGGAAFLVMAFMG